VTDPDPLVHAVCEANADRLTAEYRAALIRERAQCRADMRIAAHVRWLLLPGHTRKTIRVADLATVVTGAEAAAS